MIVVIDPNVFKASPTDSGCKDMVLQVYNKLDDLRIAVVKKGHIIGAYWEFLEDNFDADDLPLAAELLQHALLQVKDHDEQITLNFPSELSNKLRKKLQAYGCNTPVELELMGIGANAKHVGMKLLMVGESVNRSLPERWLNDQNKLGRLRREIPWLEVHFASKKGQIFAPPLIIHQKARIFELIVAIKLQTQHKNLRCVEVPEEVIKHLKKNEDIDLYGYEQHQDTLTVWVGECKLREEGNERSKLLTTDDFNQLPKRKKVVEEYENNRSDLESHIIKFRYLVISNAKDFRDDLTRDKAKEDKIEFWHAQLTSGWTTDQHWGIRELKQKFPPLEQEGKVR